MKKSDRKEHNQVKFKNLIIKASMKKKKESQVMIQKKQTN